MSSSILVAHKKTATGGSTLVASGGTSISFDPSTNTYVLRDSKGSTSAFGPANLVAAESNASYTVYRSTNGSVTETLKKLNSGSSNPTIALTYASYAVWQRDAGGTAGTDVETRYIVYGTKTDTLSLPRSGTASYAAVADGTYIQSSSSGATTYAVSGDINFLANFGNSTISYTAALTGTSGTGSVINFGPLAGSGSITRWNSSFWAAPNRSVNPDYSMSASGYFYGPGAPEIGGTFSLTKSDGSGSGGGAFVGIGQ